MSGRRARAVVATPLSEELCTRIEQAEPRLQLVREQELLPPMRHPADFAGDPSFRRTPAQQKRFDDLIDSAEVLYGIPDVDPTALARTVRSNSRLRWVQVMAAGGGSQVRAARLTDSELRRVSFTTSAGVHGDPLAEFALFGLLAGAKSLPRLLDQQRRREWSGRWAMGRLHGSTVLVLGLGGIGATVARLLGMLGVEIIGVSRHGRPVPHVDEVIPLDLLPQAAKRADAVVATLPGTDSTERLLDDEFFTALHPGATFVNVGRGTVVDEDALVTALDTGQVGLAVLDVTATEPLPAESPLWTHPRVLLSPHTAALDPAEDRRIADLFALNASRYLDGQPLQNLVDIEQFY